MELAQFQYHWLVWGIFFLPLLSFLTIALIIRPFFRSNPRLGGYTAVAAIGGAFCLALWAFVNVLNAEGHELAMPDFDWLTVGDLTIRLGLTVDSLTAVMLIVVTGVSLMVQVYSQGYMHGDPGYHRYFAFMSLFTASMLGLVLADNLVMLFVFWEGVGLCSYLLIGFWFERPSAAAAAKKAFIVTRFGDFGFLVAVLFLIFKTGTVDIGELHTLAATGVLSGMALTWAAVGIFAGAMGKSAQFPLHVWLPDAMEGPTPVSALIHAATMVAAGVYLVARLLPLFEHSEQAITVVATIGAVTAIFAASMGLVMTDIKRVLAYSTISQLGYMMLGLGTGSVVAGIFHLFNHAFFKALLFMGAGSVNHASGTFDMREMGGLRKYMPWTFATFVVAALSLAGIWPLSGFWSKDEILIRAWEHRPALFYLAMITVFMTSFYMFRVIFLTFGGSYRGSTSSEHGGHGGGGLHESPTVMVFPLVVLGIMAVVSGWLNTTGWFSEFLEEHGEGHGFFGLFTHPQAVPWLSLLISGLGIGFAWLTYSRRVISAEAIRGAFRPIHTLLSRKYFFDDLYENVIVRGLLYRVTSSVLDAFDRYVIDGTVNGVGWVGRNLGAVVADILQIGQVPAYGLAIFVGTLLAIAAFWIWGG